VRCHPGVFVIRHQPRLRSGIFAACFASQTTRVEVADYRRL
jgi:hypothetical protein